jgi:1-acyl-sn-glycerol-3-phosphate acyltransferase
VLDLTKLISMDPMYKPAWMAGSRALAHGLFNLPRRTKIEVEGLEHLQNAGLAIITANHTHRYDFLPIRYALDARDINIVTWVKARDYRSASRSLVLSKMGNIPIASRGYLICADFAGEFGRSPTEEEYRQLRDHVDVGFAADPALLDGLVRPRSIMGSTADPSQLGYAGAIRQAYYEFMMTTLDKARMARDAGRHVQIYPQGATSGQLTPGKNGAVQAAIALGLPIVPVGISGCRGVFKGATPVSKGGVITIRFGEPIELQREFLPEGFRPYHPDDEATHREVLTEWTQDVMDRIAGLCDPDCRWAPDLKSDAKQGIARFYA